MNTDTKRKIEFKKTEEKKYQTKNSNAIQFCNFGNRKWLE